MKKLELKLTQGSLVHYGRYHLFGTPRFTAADLDAYTEYRIASLSPFFVEHFIEPDGGIEEYHVEERDLDSWNLTGNKASIAEIIAKFDAKKVRSHMAHMARVIGLGADGPGIYTGAPNVHFIESAKNGLLVAAWWQLFPDGLHFGAADESDPVGLMAGSRINTYA